MKRFILFILILSLPLISCSQSAKSAEQILASVTQGLSDLPAGHVRILGAPEYDPHYLPISLLRVMLASSEQFEEEDKISELALFLSETEELCEIAIFCADSSSSAEDLAELCAKRVNMLKSSPSLSKKNKEIAENSKIVLSGRYLLYAVSESAEEISEVFRASLP